MAGTAFERELQSRVCVNWRVNNKPDFRFHRHLSQAPYIVSNHNRRSVPYYYP
jgi:hypothetical protein